MANSVNREEKIEMTRESYDELVKELEHRKSVERAAIAKEISDARDLGDLSENHAYTVAMEKKDMNENRITDLETLLKNVRIVKSSASKVVATIGSSVEIKNLTTNSGRTVVLVGAEETQAADPREGKISIDSPIGKAVLNSKVGDVVEVLLPIGNTKFKIEKIS